MKRRIFLEALGAFGVNGAVCYSAFGLESQVRRLEVIKPYNYPGLKEFKIELPGKYFLSEDHIQKKYHMARGGRILSVTGGMMLNIFCGDVDVDLHGHTLGADAEMGGIIFSPKDNERYSEFLTGKFREAALLGRNVSIRNGVIDLARGKNTGMGIVFSTMWRESAVRTVGRPVGMNTGKISYERTNYRIEDLSVLTKLVAVEIEGNYTSIVNCRIESEDIAAIFSAGSNVLIEGCDIRLKNSSRKYGVPRAAIVLRDGCNGIIRNNRIRVDQGKHKEDGTYGILVRDGATNVLIEKNLFINTAGNPVMLADGAEAILRDNKTKSSRF